jgi:hypothetical protein
VLASSSSSIHGTHSTMPGTSAFVKEAERSPGGAPATRSVGHLPVERKTLLLGSHSYGPSCSVGVPLPASKAKGNTDSLLRMTPPYSSLLPMRNVNASAS